MTPEQLLLVAVGIAIAISLLLFLLGRLIYQRWSRHRLEAAARRDYGRDTPKSREPVRFIVISGEIPKK